MKRKSNVFDWVEKTACTVGALALAAMAAVLGCGIVSRYIFGKPIPGVYDIVQLLLIWVVFLSLSFTQKEERHIRVEIVMRTLSERPKAWFDIAATTIGAVLCLIMSWQSAKMAYASVINGEYWPGLLRVPIYPSKIVLFLGLAILSIRFILDTKTNIIRLKGNKLSTDN